LMSSITRVPLLARSELLVDGPWPRSTPFHLIDAGALHLAELVGHRPKPRAAAAGVPTVRGRRCRRRHQPARRRHPRSIAHQR
jgi:hypothetical protein